MPSPSRSTSYNSRLDPIGWAFADEILDVAAMLLMWRLLGFHPLLLPTFVLEVVPLADLAPTWTVCVAIVIALRRKQQNAPPAPPHARARYRRVSARMASAARRLAPPPPRRSRTSRRPFLICAARAGSVSIDTASAATASGVNAS